MAYQPIVDLSTREVGSYEILLRMRDTNGELILPGEFLPAAERFGLAKKIDGWVITQAIHTLADLHKNDSTLRFSVNLSTCPSPLIPTRAPPRPAPDRSDYRCFLSIFPDSSAHTP